jgi:uncharacterized membrane protein SpoIIM required for sporulation
VLYFRKIARFIIPVMILTVLCFVLNSNLNQHYHKLASGSIVKHAHPYKKENSGVPFQSHNHSSFEFLLLDNISIALFTFIFFLLTLTLFPRFLNNAYFPILEIYKPTDLYFLKNYHAPPATRY